MKIRLDGRALCAPAMLAAGDAAAMAYLRALAWSAAEGTDGVVPAGMLAPHVSTLREVGLTVIDDDLLVRLATYADHAPMRAEVLRSRDAARTRMQRIRERDATREVVDHRLTRGHPEPVAAQKVSLSEREEEPQTGSREHRANIERTPSEQLRLLWNDLADPKLPRWQAKSAKRRTAAAARLKELPDLVDWARVIDVINRSPWHLGANDRGWMAGPDFLLRTETWARALEGSLGNVQPEPRSAELEAYVRDLLAAEHGE